VFYTAGDKGNCHGDKSGQYCGCVWTFICCSVVGVDSARPCDISSSSRVRKWCISCQIFHYAYNSQLNSSCETWECPLINSLHTDFAPRFPGFDYCEINVAEK